MTNGETGSPYKDQYGPFIHLDRLTQLPQIVNDEVNRAVYRYARQGLK